MTPHSAPVFIPSRLRSLPPQRPAKKQAAAVINTAAAPENPSAESVNSMKSANTADNMSVTAIPVIKPAVYGKKRRSFFTLRIQASREISLLAIYAPLVLNMAESY